MGVHRTGRLGLGPDALPPPREWRFGGGGVVAFLVVGLWGFLPLTVPEVPLCKVFTPASPPGSGT